MLPRPYPDELVGSIITRGAIHSGLAPKRLLSDLMDSPRSNLSYFMPVGLRTLSARMRLAPEELLWNHTVFPYCCAYMTDGEVARLENAFLHSESTSERCSAALVASITRGSARLRFCAECVVDDTVEYGESYWHRKHSLPATHVCTSHGTALRSLVLGQSSRAFALGLPHHQTTCKNDGPNLAQSTLELLAKHSGNLLTAKPSSSRGIHERYRQLALGKGYATDRRQVSSRRLSDDLRIWFGSDYLAQLGSAITATVQTWPALMTRRSTSVTFAPVKHVLLKCFLDECTSDMKRTTHAKPGPKPREIAALDLEVAAHIRRATQRAVRRGSVITVRELLVRSGHWHIYRHRSTEMPATSAAVVEFRRTDVSQRKLGGRLAHQKNMARRAARQRIG